MHKEVRDIESKIRNLEYVYHKCIYYNTPEYERYANICSKDKSKLYELTILETAIPYKFLLKFRHKKYYGTNSHGYMRDFIHDLLHKAYNLRIQLYLRLSKGKRR